MKMQNIIRTRRAGAKVGKLQGKVGATLRADEILLEIKRSDPYALI
jgi:biotin carboxyl carrier protein